MIFSPGGVLGLLGVMLPALALAFVVHRWVEGLDWKTVATAPGISLVALGPSVYRETLPVPVDAVARGYPYRGIVGEVAVGNPLTNDTTRQMLPWMQVVRESYADFRAPLWNPYSFAGYPLLANGQSAPFSPFFVATLFVPLPYQILSMAGLKVFVAMLFGILLFRRQGLRQGAAVAGAVVFAFSIFQTVYLYFPITAVTSFLPALLFFAHRSFFSRGHCADQVGLSLVTASILAGGHPESAVHCALGAAFFLAIEAFGNGKAIAGRWKELPRRIVVPVLVGLLLAAPAVLPFIDHALQSDRINTLATQEMTPSRPLGEWQVFGHPDRFGNPALGTWTGPANYCVVAPTYLGLTLVALAIASLLSRGDHLRRKLFVLTGLVLFGVALGWKPFAYVNEIPPLVWSVNDRLRFVGIVFIALGAVPVLDRVRRGTAAAAAVGTAAAIVIWWFSWGRRLTGVAGLSDIVGLVAVAAVGLAVVAIPDARRGLVGTAAAILVTLELITLTQPFNAPCSIEYFHPDLPIIEALHEHAEAGEMFRVVGRDWVLLPNASAHYGLEDIRGSDPMAWRPYLGFLDIVAKPSHRFSIRRVARFPQPALDFLGVRYVLARPGIRLPSGYETVYSGPDGDLWFNPKALPRFFAPAKVVSARSPGEALDRCRNIVDFRETAIFEGEIPAGEDQEAVHILRVARRHRGAYELTIRADEPGFVASSIPAVAGWRLRINGDDQDPATVNSAFLGFRVGAGSSLVSLRYRPRSFALGIGAHLLGIGILIVMTFSTLKKSQLIAPSARSVPKILTARHAPDRKRA